MGIVGLKIVHSLNRINRCIKFTAENGTDLILVNSVVFFYRFVDFLSRNTLTELYFNKPIHISDQYCIEKLPNDERFGAYGNSHLVVLRSEVTFFCPFLV